METNSNHAMLPTYPAILSDDHIEWTGEIPTGLPARARVRVTLLDPPSPAASKQGSRMAAALEAVAARGGLAAISDPLQWEREQREERPLPGRES
jgi:hypothetical protein